MDGLNIVVTTLVLPDVELTIEDDTVRCSLDGFKVYFDDAQIKSLYVEPASGQSFKLMACQEKQGALVLDHLEVPGNYTDQGWGKLAIAFFYYLCQDKGYREYAMKFGGGAESKDFLLHLGFDESFVHTAQDTDFAGESVMVGEFEKTGQRSYDWKLDPISVSRFPTEFLYIDS